MCLSVCVCVCVCVCVWGGGGGGGGGELVDEYDKTVIVFKQAVPHTLLKPITTCFVIYCNMTEARLSICQSAKLKPKSNETYKPVKKCILKWPSANLWPFC